MIEVVACGRVASDSKVFGYGTGGQQRSGVSFGLICDRFYGDENPTYIQCTIWRGDEKIAQHITMGRQLFVIGKLTKKDQYYNIDVDQWEFGQRPRREMEQQGYGWRRSADGGGYQQPTQGREQPAWGGGYDVSQGGSWQGQDGGDGLPF